MKRSPFKQVGKRIKQMSKKRQKYRASDQGQSDLAYMCLVRQLPCIICEAFGMTQTSPTEAHHCKSGRYSTSKEHDRKTIPLCQCHHQGLRFDRDKTKVAYHQGQETWEALYGRDYDFVDVTLDAVNRLT